MTVELYLGDCLGLMPKILDGSVDAIICDLPYGSTACKWDIVIPFAPLWAEYERIIKPRGAIVLTASQPFTTLLIGSNLEWFKYTWVWDKHNPAGHLNAKIMPLPVHEDVVVFGQGKVTYNPQMRTGRWRKRESPKRHSECYGAQRHVVSYGDQYYPVSIVDFSNADQANKDHPTQKPVALMEYLIRTYTSEGETVLDNTMGSGTTGVACVNTGRNFIGIESDPNYYAVAQSRIAKVQEEAASALFDPNTIERQYESLNLFDAP